MQLRTCIIIIVSLGQTFVIQKINEMQRLQ